jgi:hypothetical protein
MLYVFLGVKLAIPVTGGGGRRDDITYRTHKNVTTSSVGREDHFFDFRFAFFAGLDSIDGVLRLEVTWLLESLLRLEATGSGF